LYSFSVSTFIQACCASRAIFFNAIAFALLSSIESKLDELASILISYLSRAFLNTSLSTVKNLPSSHLRVVEFSILSKAHSAIL
jgi:hypothetical protein